MLKVRGICDSPKYDMDCLVFKLKDYGKTWAFDKETLIRKELENDVTRITRCFRK